MPSSWELRKKYFFDPSWARSYGRLWDLASALREPQSVREVSSCTPVTEVMWGQNQNLRLPGCGRAEGSPAVKPMSFHSACQVIPVCLSFLVYK